MTPGADWSDRPAMQRGKLVADRDNLWNIDGRDYGGHRNMTDAEGRVTLPAFIPGATYDIYDQANGQALKKNIRARHRGDPRPRGRGSQKDKLTRRPLT